MVCEGASFRPRQFEFNPHDDGTLVFGTTHGEVVVARVPEPGKKDDDGAAESLQGGRRPQRQHPDVAAAFLEKPFFLGKDRHDSILGYVRVLCAVPSSPLDSPPRHKFNVPSSV